MKKIITLLTCIFTLSASQIYSQSNVTLSIQGVLKKSDGTALEDGDKYITFKLYTQATGGSDVWSELDTVSLTNGVYSVELGKNVSLPPFTQAHYLGVTVQGETEMLPRTLLTASPYAQAMLVAKTIITAFTDILYLNRTKHKMKSSHKFDIAIL